MVDIMTGLVTTVWSWDNVVCIVPGLVPTIWSWDSVVDVLLEYEMEDFWFQFR